MPEVRNDPGLPSNLLITTLKKFFELIYRINALKKPLTGYRKFTKYRELKGGLILIFSLVQNEK